MQRNDDPEASADGPMAMNRRRILRTLGAGATASALGLTALSGTAAAHDLQVEFPDCRTVLIVVNDTSEFGVLKETVHVYDGDAGEVKEVPVELTPENTRPLPDHFGDRPVFAASVSGDSHIVGVETGDGRMYENPNDCRGAADDADDDDGADDGGDGLSQVAIVAHRDPGSVTSPDDYVDYVFEVTGDLEELEPDEDSGVAVDEISDRGDRVRVTGAVGTGDDRFAFSGELVEVDVPSAVTIEIRNR